MTVVRIVYFRLAVFTAPKWSRTSSRQTGRLRSAQRASLFPYRIFSKDQRVSHTTVVENKRLATLSRS